MANRKSAAKTVRNRARRGTGGASSHSGSGYPEPQLILGPWDVTLDNGSVIVGGMHISGFTQGRPVSTVKGTFLGKPMYECYR